LVGERQQIAYSDEDLSSLVGEVREGVTLVQNLVQILRSPRVGPRQLSRALPELVSACDQVVGPLSRLATASADVLSTDRPAVEALAELSSRSIACLRAVSAQLADTVGEGLGARRRLEIDALASSAAEELSELCRLGELASYVAAPRPDRVDLADVAGVGRDRPQAERMAQVDVRLLRLFLEVAAKAVTGVALEGAIEKGLINMHRAADGSHVLSLRAASAWSASGALDADHRVLAGVARRSGWEWVLTESVGTLTLTP